MSKVTENKQPALLPIGPVLLIAASAALAMLAVFQWMELRLLAAGGETVCGVSESVNCGAVWTSSFAKRIHASVGMPIAGLGLVYALTALGLSVTLVHRALSAKALSPIITALRLTALIGVLTCITMFVASMRIGSVCLTCVATYLLVLAFAVVAVKLLPGALQPAEADIKPAILWSGAFAVAAFLVLLYPGLQTKGPGALPKLPPAKTSSAAAHGTGDGHNHGSGALDVHGPGDGHNHGSGTPLAQFIDGLQPMERRALSEALNGFRTSTVPPGTARFQTRFKKGPDNAPVRIVDFVDIKCGHCRMLEEAMGSVAAAVPPNSFSIEPRYFPLDSECNKTSKHTDNSGTRCAAAKASICLEGTDFYWKARGEMFDEQETLTKERVLELASKGPLSRQQLESCIADPKTQQKVDEDVAYAMLYEIPGTPLVLINGREGSPMPGFLYAMIMSGGNVAAPELKPILAGR